MPTITSAAPQANVPIQPQAVQQANRPADLQESYKERHLGDLGITVKYNPAIPEHQVDSSLAAVSVHRTVGDKLGMTTHALHSVVESGKDAVLSARAPFLTGASPAQETSETHKAIASSTDAIKSLPDSSYLKTEGRWLDASTVQVPAPGNVFGASGLFASAETSLEIPLVTPASPNRDDIAAAFGVRIFDEGQTIPLKFDGNLNAVEYEFGKAYPQYRLDVANGFFIETHDFPHVFMPASEQSEIVITIGKQLEEDQFALTNFLVPHGSGILVPGNTIHADAFSTGNIIAMLTHCTEADVVLMHQPDDSPLPIKVDSSERLGLAEWHV
ncbi:hypothetical protein ACMG4P_02480 [Pseudovibrio denitrificans]|uniref:hypothetical protein n=1 Tax=Pseudovibrio denitrificans TaxID=258256 RepID=UPI0039BED7AC